MTMLRRTLLTLSASVGLMSIPATAQITSPITASIPFPFTVVDTQLPAGDYTIRVPSDTSLSILEIESADGKVKVMFPAGEADLPGRSSKTELEFYKYGDREFLAGIFEEGTTIGAEAFKGHAELKMIKSKVKRTVHRHPAKKH